MTEKTYRFIWLFLLITALLIRVGVGFYWNKFVGENLPNKLLDVSTDDGPFFYGDSDSYWKLGRALAFGRPYEFDKQRRWQVFRTPGYPALLAPLFWIYGENPPTLAARFEGALFGTLNVALVGWITFVIFGFNSRSRIIAVISGIIIALDPTEALQSVSILSEEPFMSFSLLLNIAIIKAARYFGLLSTDVQNKDDSKSQNEFILPNKAITPPAQLTLKNTILHATALATAQTSAIYLRPSWYYYLPFSLLILFIVRFIIDWSSGRFRKNRLWTSQVLLSLSICLLTTIFLINLLLSPWIIRNYKLTGQPIKTTLQMGASLYDGLSPYATGASNMDFIDSFRTKEISTPSDSENIHFEVRLDNRLKEASISWTKNHPKEALNLAFIKFYRLWSPIPREKAFNTPFLKISLIISYLPPLFLGLLGLIRAIRIDHPVWFLIIPAFYITSLHTIFVSSIRYRVPVMYGFAILGAFWLVETYCARLSGRAHSNVPSKASVVNNR